MQDASSETFSFFEYGWDRFLRFTDKIIRENPDADNAELEAMMRHEQGDFLRRTREYAKNHSELLTRG